MDRHLFKALFRGITSRLDRNRNELGMNINKNQNIENEETEFIRDKH